MSSDKSIQRKLNITSDALKKIKCLVEAIQYLTATDSETETRLEIIDRVFDLVGRVLEDIDE